MKASIDYCPNCEEKMSHKVISFWYFGWYIRYTSCLVCNHVEKTVEKKLVPDWLHMILHAYWAKSRLKLLFLDLRLHNWIRLIKSSFSLETHRKFWNSLRPSEDYLC
ncbi:MAG: hypothetical protein F6K54_16270 [Okeania sp. SIO3B5]|uniref:hypothetical protein n=1 Tax=Okeania sp. SIO3B5 TaxID=2607811 RepID=UPI0014019482|nr:hypothetical protein [Okeania sp. SIO3B5]NEO54499.1 hypothetical protein [Okeania sp. SIO3B5]